MVSVTDIFSEQTQQTINAVEVFFKQVVGDKMLWTRDILVWFGIKSEDMPIFLSFHQIQKLRYEQADLFR